MNIVIYLSQKLLLSVSFLVYLYSVWRLGRQAGFNKEKVLDLGIFSLTFALLVQFIFFQFGFSYISIFFVGQAVFIYWYCRLESWSVLKIGDIFAGSLVLAGFFYPNFPHPLFNLALLPVYLIIRRVGILKPRTGFVFLGFLCLFAFFLTVFSYFQNHRVVYPDLALALVALGFSVLGLKNKEYKESMTLLKYTLPSDILEKIKNKLAEKQLALNSQEKNLAEAEKSLESGAERSAEEQDQALTAGEKIKNDNLLTFVKDNKNQVDLALKKIDTGSYGLCEKCGQPVDHARLLVFPEARFCFNCEPKEENEEINVTSQ